MKRLLFIVIGLFCFCLMSISAQAQSAVPALESAVTDNASALSPAQRLELENILTTFSKEKGSQIAVLIVKSTEPEQIEQYSIRVADAWKLGRKGIDDGVLLVVATEDRRIRIEVGYGLEGAVPDARAKRIIEDYILPKFRQGEVYSGIRAGVDVLIQLINGEDFPRPENQTPEALDAVEPLVRAIIVGLVASHALRLMVGTPLAMLITATVTFTLGLLVSLQFASILTVIVVVFSMAGLGSYRHGSGGGYRGGGTSGGFRGGGGSFGGGGASGRW
jgi:uncharacterized protein